ARTSPAAFRLGPRGDARLARSPRSARESRRQALLRPRPGLLEGRPAGAGAGLLTHFFPSRDLRRGSVREALGRQIYSAAIPPEPPNSFGKSLNFGRPSFIGSTVSA